MEHLMIKLLNIFAILTAFVTCSSCVTTEKIRETTPNLIPYGSQTNGKNLYPSTVRLVSSDGYFFCTGTVIDAKYIMTAAHCLEDAGVMTTGTIYIYDMYSNPVGGVAKAVGVDFLRDVGFLMGNFADFEPAKVDFTGQYIKKGMMMKSCGFPAGQYNIYCTELKLVGNIYFKMQTTGAPIFKGCSGGPVIDEASGYIIGVNSAVGDNMVVVGPVVGVLEELGLR